MHPSLRVIAVCSIASGAMMLTGCVPYPTYKLVQPEASATILDEAHQPVVNARVALVAQAVPGRSDERSRSEQRTNKDGKVSFEEHHEWQAESLMIHGRQFYYWNWCVEKTGYETFSTSYGISDSFDAHPEIILKPGASLSCDHFPPR